MADLAGFAYGEDLEEGSRRSLGYRLLAPAAPAPWAAEVEALARRLQAAPYPDNWPATDLFCSVFLDDGRRLLAAARYGLSDHTPARRRGGLELIGVVGPAALDVPAALAVYRWLLRHRAETDDLHQLGEGVTLQEVLAAVPPAPAEPGPRPVLPVRLWQDGAFLFAASTPGDPDLHLSLLEGAAGAGWQWLPLVGPDFPLLRYAQRGPLVAWTPHLAGVALKLDKKPDSAAVPVPRRRALRWLTPALVLLLVGVLLANQWHLRAINQRLAAIPTAPEKAAEPPAKRVETPPVRESADGRERFAAALHRLLRENGAGDLLKDRTALLERYDELEARQKDLRLAEDDVEGKLAVGAVAVLAGRSGERIEAAVRQALSDKGFSDKVVRAACEHVREQFAEGKGRR
jgi:hypothetical protein